jgi:tellurite resistance protein TerC
MIDWIIFAVLIATLVALDLGVFNRRQHPMKIKEAALWTCCWIAISLGFNLYVWISRGEDAGLQFFTGYLLEKSLSVDNIFVFAVVFAYFKIPQHFQHKVLYYGIFGALLFRMVLIFTGVVLISKFTWLLYLLGAFLALTGIKLIFQKKEQKDLSENWAVKLTRRFIPITSDYDGERFFLKTTKSGWMATPLFVALLVIESVDIIFALDSIPAIFAVTSDPFIIYTSNIFAILGLRSIYFILAASIEKFHYLKTGLGTILVMIGLKMLIQPFYEIPLLWMVLLILADLSIAITMSILYPPKPQKK